uniref:Uncharacterized protein n=1 Tax=Oryza sativa subsp. japonica TaxID=39947 RepID=Q6YY38_ORYSJ|nr:unknown protein [Oryza sativa Japonica Group]BAD29336.1 unknown protein [Oryza sativa Japonica Group]
MGPTCQFHTQINKKMVGPTWAPHVILTPTSSSSPIPSLATVSAVPGTTTSRRLRRRVRPPLPHSVPSASRRRSPARSAPPSQLRAAARRKTTTTRLAPSAWLGRELDTAHRRHRGGGGGYHGGRLCWRESGNRRPASRLPPSRSHTPLLSHGSTVPAPPL